MRWSRINRRWGGRLALFALALQLGLSFGHIHAEDLGLATSTNAVAYHVNTSAADDGLPAQDRDGPRYVCYLHCTGSHRELGVANRCVTHIARDVRLEMASRNSISASYFPPQVVLSSSRSTLRLTSVVPHLQRAPAWALAAFRCPLSCGELFSHVAANYVRVATGHLESYLISRQPGTGANRAA